jgi:hypothetical protein
MFFSRHTARILAKLKRQYLTSANEPSRLEMRARNIDYVRNALPGWAGGREENITDSLSRLGTWHGINGIAALEGGALEDGWTLIHTAWLYEALALRLHISRFQKQRGLGPFGWPRSLEREASSVALCLAYGQVFKREFEVSFFGDALRVMLLDTTVVPDEYWQYHHLEPFLVQLLALARGEVLNLARDYRRSLGQYQAIIDRWGDADGLREALFAACEYHCQRMEDESEEFRAEFIAAPFDVVPAEIMAVYAVRRELGLATPEVDHPLYKAPYVCPVGSPADISDELLDQVEREF